MQTIITDLSKKARKVLLTINNPNKNETTPKGWLIDDNAIRCALNGDEEAKQYIINEVRNYIDNSDIIKGKTGVYYCFSLEIGKEGTLHLHIFFNFENPRFGNKIKKIFPTAHIDYCRGSNKSVKEYVFKTGKWEGDEKEDTRINGVQFENGELPPEKGQGDRTDLEMIKDLVDSGLSPQEILDADPNRYRYEGYIRKMYFDKRKKETPIKREVEVVVHIGVAGAGKSNIMTRLDENKMFVAADYSTGLFDGYGGEEILFLDEFRGQIPYNQLLLMLDGYKVPIHARYANVLSVWNTVHLTSVIPVEEWYNNDNIRDTFEQLKRRIDKVVLHIMYDKKTHALIKDKMAFLKKHNREDIVYEEYSVSAEKYENYDELEKEACVALNIDYGYNEIEWDDIPCPTLEEEYHKWLERRGLLQCKSPTTFNEFLDWKTKCTQAA